MISLGATLALVVLTSPTPQDSQNANWGGTGIVRAADLDRTDDVTPEEWEAFLELLAADDDGVVDLRKIQVRVYARSMDIDRDGRLTPEDLLALIEWLDENGDGDISTKELNPGTGGGMGRWANLFAAAIVKGSIDSDASGDITLDEIGAFIDSLEITAEETVEDESVLQWVEFVAAHPSDQESAFTPHSYLGTIAAGSDPDGDGEITLDDMWMLFERHDLNGDGALGKDEIGFGRGGAGRGGRGRGGRNGEGGAVRAAPPQPLMPWQRSLDDALALVAKTGKPLLICVNMDEEMASESLARARYRDPKFVELAKGFIPLLASPNRRNKRDYDDHGHRILDEKFGRLVNAEHIDIEPELYRRYFNGQRVAPRHVGVDKDGNILFDVFLVNDLRAVDDALRKHGKPELADIEPELTGEFELLDSPAAAHRLALEKLFVGGDERTRVRLTSLALSSVRRTQHPDILQLALRDESERVRTEAVWTLVRHPDNAPLDLYLPAFRTVENEPTVAAALIEALGHLADHTEDTETESRARKLQKVFTGIQMDSEVLDVDRWRVALSWAPETKTSLSRGSTELAERMSRLEKHLKRNPADSEANLAFAAASMSYAELTIREGRNPSFLLEDVLTSAAAANSGPEPDGRALAYMAWASYMLNDIEAAHDYATEAATEMVPWAGTPLAAKLLELLATIHVRSVYAAMGPAGLDWQNEWIADACAAYEILLEHPNGTEDQVIAYIDFLNAIEAPGRQTEILATAVAKHPLSGRLHSYLRGQLLEERGADELESTYAAFVVEAEDSSTFQWYRALAHLVAAERFVQNRETTKALEAYDASIKEFLASVDSQPDYERSATHYLTFAYSGTARVHTDAGTWQDAIQSVRKSVATSSASLKKEDGLGHTPTANASYLYKALRDSGRSVEAENLKDFLTRQGLDVEA